jgi:O-antigen/teichoic acid export membrane protein
MRRVGNGTHHSRSGGLAGAATRGVFWAIATSAAAKVVALGSTLVLARLLDSEAFGVAAYALTFTSLLELLRGLGIAQALIFFPRDDRRTSTAFWIIVANGVLLAAVALALAPAAGVFFRDARAPGVFRPLALYFPLLALGQVLDVELRKDLRFGRRFGPELARSLAKALVGVGLAALGAGYWSLLGAHVAGAAAFTAALWVVVPWRPQLTFDRTEARRLFDYGKHMVVVALLGAVVLRADHLTIGRFLGPEALGVYTVAFALPALVFQGSSGLSQILFPAYARLDRDRARLRSAALRTLRLAAAVFVPVGVGIALLPEPLILVAFGPEWRDAIAVLPWLGAWAVITSLTQHFGEVYKALGHTRLLAWLSAITAVLLVPGLVWVASRGGGLVGIVAVLIAVRLVRLVLDVIAVWKLIDLRPAAALYNVVPAFVSAAVMAPVVYALDRYTAALPQAARLALLVAAGAAVYAAALAALDRGLLAEIRELLRAAVAKTSSRGEPGLI